MELKFKFFDLINCYENFPVYKLYETKQYFLSTQVILTY